MPRTALRALARALLPVLAVWPALGLAAGLDPHLDPTLVTAGCRGCHEGHAVARSPMLPGPQRALCLTCHGSAADADRAVREGKMSQRARPPLLTSVLDLPSSHPVSRRAFSAREPDTVTCTSCHSPHRGTRDQGSARAQGRKRLSPRNDGAFEYQLCEECHGSEGPATQSLLDLSRLLSPDSRSYHPVEAPSRERSPSVLPALVNAEVNCTDCHGNSNPNGPRGPHGSVEPFLLRARHPTVDRSGESDLCYSCHTREKVLAAASFPEHRSHVVDLGAACATCHNPHGSVENRALIRFGEETTIASVTPSTTTRRLAYESLIAGSGSCELTCHGKDHGPAFYGGAPGMPGGLLPRP